ncbi:G2/mitotic-specific cyclin-B1-like [Latimeria chalumnae]|uniref:G2/mitotic-specific cyclin-B1-like n=1 Tax=Latimeria chalumnae TaxID=7897 RepID=UPI0003C13BA6|nr:PREDICTED: G2/mitotic-specific cyclin-B1-like [Latimeria chalumnae]|eukprot:XP_006013721.1 PREDICTED: G2/mitotic-specific cyclin-B1-like [Latimeria chalumnae]
MFCSEYAKDVYRYLKQLEMERLIRPRYLEGQEITGNMRAILIDWLVQVHLKFCLLQETMFLTVAIIDRFLQNSPASKRTLQLIGVTAMLVASKYEEVYPPEICDFVLITNNTFSKWNIQEMERRILKELDFALGCPISLCFLQRASKIGGATAEEHTLGKYFLELSMVDYEMVHYPPSQIAAASCLLAIGLLSGGKWTPILQHYLCYNEGDLIPIMQHIAKNVVRVNEGMTKHMAVKNKYASIKQMRISTIPHLKSTRILELAEPLLPPPPQNIDCGSLSCNL